MRKNKLLAATLAMVMCSAVGVGITQIAKDNEVATITASAEDLGVIQISSATTAWLADSNKRLLFKLPDSVSGSQFVMQDGGSISITRGDNTWTSNYAFQIDTYEDHGYIEMWVFGNYDMTYSNGGKFVLTTGDKVVINGTFSNGTDSFTLENATIVVNSTATGDMSVVVDAGDTEVEVVNAGYGGYVAEWDNSWKGNYYPQMYITTNSKIAAGTYTQVNENAITLTRNGTVYNLPVGGYLTVGGDNNGTQQFDFTLWPLGNPLGVSYAAQEGDILTVDGQFTNGTVTFEVQKTEITNLVGKACTHSVVPVYTATVTDEAGETVSSFEIGHGSVVEQPKTPEKEAGEGQTVIFDGWYNGDTKWDFSTAVTGDVTLTPKFLLATAIGGGYTNPNGAWMGTSYYFGLQPNAIANGGHLRPTAAECMKVKRGGVETAIGHTERDTIYKHEDGLYKIESWTLTDWKDLQEGDVLVLEGIWTDGTNNYAIEKTEIAVVANEGTSFYSYVVGDTFTVTLLKEDGSELSSAEITPYSVIEQPETPAKEAEEGYEANFLGWYNGEEKWDFTAKVTGDITLTPKFEVKAIEYTVAFVHPRTGMPLAAPIAYTVETMGEVVFPEVPADLAMEGYTVAWDKTPADLTIGGLNVSPVYTVIEYTVTFVADDQTVATETYTVENTEITVPEVPEKEGYTGVWEAYELTTGDVTVNAVYTAIEIPDDSSSEPTTSEPDDSSDDPTTSESGDSSDDSTTSEPTTSEPVESSEEEKKSGGCGGVIGGVSAALTLVAAAAIVMKKKED